MYNAPYDLGVLSALWEGKNSYKWVEKKDTNFWEMVIFGGKYTVKRINGFRNNIKHGVITTDINSEKYDPRKRRPKAPPVIDLLKLWSILVDDGSTHSISLKALIERELHEEAIHYNEVIAHTEAYQKQDVVALGKLWFVFLDRVKTIADVKGYSYDEWAEVCTPATFCKRAYKRAYFGLKEHQKHNDAEDEKHSLTAGIAEAYHGGITVSLYRGVLDNIAWFDIHGAYAHVIEYENTDQYIKYSWSKMVATRTQLKRDNRPLLCRVLTNVVFASINKSMKIYRIIKPTLTWMWSYDIIALRLLFSDARIDIAEIYRLNPCIPTRTSLPATWSRLKEEEQKAHGKTTLREYYKLMSNTSYGIKAQRKPFRTQHTNLPIAGIITARAHLILAEMIDEARLHGCVWRYSDTDSIAVSMYDNDAKTLEDDINKRVYPYSVECEACRSNLKVLSLKRYISTNRHNLEDHIGKDKICLHGKSIYKISASEILAMINGEKPSRKPLMLASVAANTERTMRRVLKLNPVCHAHIHPFAFETDSMSDISIAEWFEAWYAHIDTKLTYPDNSDVDAEFVREFRTFDTNTAAQLFYGSMCADEETKTEYNDTARNYDDEDAFFYCDSSVSDSDDAE